MYIYIYLLPGTREFGEFLRSLILRNGLMETGHYLPIIYKMNTQILNNVI